MDELVVNRKWLQLVKLLGKERANAKTPDQFYNTVIERARNMACTRSALILYIAAISTTKDAARVIRVMHTDVQTNALYQMAWFMVHRVCEPLLAPIFESAWPTVDNLWIADTKKTTKDLVHAILRTLQVFAAQLAEWKQNLQTTPNHQKDLSECDLPQRRWKDWKDWSPPVEKPQGEVKRIENCTDDDATIADTFGVVAKSSPKSSVSYRDYIIGGMNDPQPMDEGHMDLGFDMYGSASEVADIHNVTIEPDIVPEFKITVNNALLDDSFMQRALMSPLVQCLPGALKHTPITTNVYQGTGLETTCHFATAEDLTCARLLWDQTFLANSFRDYWNAACAERSWVAISKRTTCHKEIVGEKEFIREWVADGLPADVIFPSTMFGIMILIHVSRFNASKLESWDLANIVPDGELTEFRQIMSEFSELAPTMQEVHHLGEPFGAAVMPRGFVPVDPFVLSPKTMADICERLVDSFRFLIPRHAHEYSRTTIIKTEDILSLCKPIAETSEVFLIPGDKCQREKKKIIGIATWADLIVSGGDYLGPFKVPLLRKMAAAAELQYYSITGQLSLFHHAPRDDLLSILTSSTLMELEWKVASTNPWIGYEFNNAHPPSSLYLSHTSATRDCLFSRCQSVTPLVYRFHQDVKVHEWGDWLRVKTPDEKGAKIMQCALKHVAIVDTNNYSISLIETDCVGLQFQHSVVLAASSSWTKEKVGRMIFKLSSLMRNATAVHTLVVDSIFTIEKLIIVCIP